MCINDIEAVKYERRDTVIELPEAMALSQQINENLKGKKIAEVVVNHSPHKLVWFNGEPEAYIPRLEGHVIEMAQSYGGIVEIALGATKLAISDGINARYLLKDEKMPAKHQLLLRFEDESVLVFYAQMYGGILCAENEEIDNEYYLVAKAKPSPLSDEFNLDYFLGMVNNQNISLKELLATKQRIPGLGNGVLQDILFNCKLHPKRKVNTLTEKEKQQLFEAIKNTLLEMVAQGGRDTERDLFGDACGYKTKLCKNTVNYPCPVCGGAITKAAYMGGSVYYCDTCQT